MTAIDRYYVANVTDDMRRQLARTVKVPHTMWDGEGFYSAEYGQEPTTIVEVLGDHDHVRTLRRITTFAWANGEDSIAWVRIDADGPRGRIVAYDIGTDKLKVERI